VLHINCRKNAIGTSPALRPGIGLREPTLGRSDELVCRIRGEFSETPGLRLTIDQGMRLWSLDRSTCVRVLNALIATGFLRKDQNERYTRTHAGY
jgi:hypothetical protein